MSLPKPVARECYSESEAARSLGISIARLHELLDRYVFNEGTRRPSDIEFSTSDILLLAYWQKDCAPANEASDTAKVVPIDSVKKVATR
jgi:hypothetical protein